MSRTVVPLVISGFGLVAAYQQVVEYRPFVRYLALGIVIVVVVAAAAAKLKPWIADKSARRDESVDDVHRRRRRRLQISAGLMLLLCAGGVVALFGTAHFHSVRVTLEADDTAEVLTLRAPGADSASVTVALLSPLESATQCRPSQLADIPAVAEQWSWGGANPELRVSGFISPQALALRCAPPVGIQVVVAPIHIGRLTRQDRADLLRYFILFGGLAWVFAVSYHYFWAYRS